MRNRSLLCLSLAALAVAAVVAYAPVAYNCPCATVFGSICLPCPTPPPEPLRPHWPKPEPTPGGVPGTETPK